MNRLSLFNRPSASDASPPANSRSSTSSSSAAPTIPPVVRAQRPQVQRRLRQYFAFNFKSWASSRSIPESGFACQDFMLGAGMVIIQPSSGKVVVCYDTKRKQYFLPKGRKDIGESLEQAAVREACEESGYQVKHYPLFKQHCQPPPPDNPQLRLQPDTEAFYVHVMSWDPRFDRNGVKYDGGGEYLTFWYLGYLAPNATWTANTGMPDEQDYTSALYDISDAHKLLEGSILSQIVDYGYAVWRCHCRILTEQRLLREKESERRRTTTPNDTP